MKKKFLITGFVFIVCLVVFIYINAKPAPMDMRFQAMAYEGDTVVEEGITVRLVGDLQENIFTKDKFTGTMTITSENYPVQYDLEFQFDKNGTGEFKMVYDDTDFGTLKISNDFKNLCVEITSEEVTNGKTVYIAAPATKLEQAQDIKNQYF